MFSNGFPKEWSTLRKLAWLYRTVINAVSAVLKTITGNPIHITDALAKPVQALSIVLEPIQAGSGDPSPDNVRPIYGHTDVDVIVSPTPNQLDGTTYPIPLGQIVYGCTLDATTGVLTVDRAEVDLTTGMAGGTAGAGYVFYKAISNPKIVPNSQIAPIISEAYIPIRFNGVSGNSNTIAIRDNGVLYVNTGSADIQPTGKAVYELATPQTIQLTPTQVELLQGENNIWSDGEMTLTYLADGNASDVEALNILLGGRYVNNHTEDEPTDREALDILLGRTTR